MKPGSFLKCKSVEEHTDSLMNEDKDETTLNDNVFTNALRPNTKQVARLVTGDNNSPIYMVNLLKFKKYANYPRSRLIT